MRKYRNILKDENEELSKAFDYLLKDNEECTSKDCCWVAATVFDHWLHEDDSYHLINDASSEQKEKWDNAVSLFLAELTRAEAPLKYKYLGRHPNKRLQFSQYIGEQSLEDHVRGLFKTTYEPNLAFPKHGMHIWFEDDWVIYIVYQSIDKVAPICELASKCGLHLLPVYSVGELNQYKVLSEAVPCVGLKN